MNEMDKVTDAELESLAAFRYALRRFLHFSEEAAREVGLTPQQHQALLSVRGLSRGGPVTIGALAEHLQIRHHSAVGLVDRLEQKGLLERQSGGADRRQVHLALTGEGEGLLIRLSAAHRDELQRIGPEISRLLSRLMSEG
jgi:DNA-binding MarR family transcriptional regulator